MKAGLKPAEIAAQCNVTSNSIRNWSKEFRIHLSEGANAPERYYTDRDATILRYISTLKQEGLKTHEIAERLAEMKFGDVESIESKPAPIALQSTLAVQDGQGNAPGVLVALQAMQTQIDALQQARQEGKHSQRDGVVMFGIGFIAALLFVIVLIGLAVLYGGFR